MNSMKRQKDMRPRKMSLPRLEGVQHVKGKSRGQLLIAPERIKLLGQSGNDAQLWMCLLVRIMSDAVKNNIA